MTRGAPMVAANGGSNDSSGCRPPMPTQVDWIFGPVETSFSGYLADRSAAVRKTTDHPMVVAEALLPPPDRGQQLPDLARALLTGYRLDVTSAEVAGWAPSPPPSPPGGTVSESAGQNDDLKAKMREALDRKNSQEKGVHQDGPVKEKAHGSEVVGGAPEDAPAQGRWRAAPERGDKPHPSSG